KTSGSKASKPAVCCSSDAAVPGRGTGCVNSRVEDLGASTRRVKVAGLALGASDRGVGREITIGLELKGAAACVWAKTAGSIAFLDTEVSGSFSGYFNCGLLASKNSIQLCKALKGGV